MAKVGGRCEGHAGGVDWCYYCILGSVPQRAPNPLKTGAIQPCLSCRVATKLEAEEQQRLTVSAGDHGAGWSAAYRVAGKLVALARQYESTAAAAAASGGGPAEEGEDAVGGRHAMSDEAAAEVVAPFVQHLRQLREEAQQQLGPGMLAELMAELKAK